VSVPFARAASRNDRSIRGSEETGVVKRGRPDFEPGYGISQDEAGMADGAKRVAVFG
jgi:hypothetical protein